MSSYKVRYQTLDFGDTDIHIQTLRDNQQYSDAHNVASDLGISSALWPLFGQLWPSGKILANHMLDFDIKGKRILELGCGLALSSHVLNGRNADITATDYHPEVETFLNENVRINGGKAIPYIRTGWADEVSDLGVFDLIIGSDVLYERGHATLLVAFIEQHAKEHTEVIIVDPGRGHRGHFTALMCDLGYTHTFLTPEAVDCLDEPYQGKILFFQR